MAYTEEKLIPSISDEIIVPNGDTKVTDALEEADLYAYDPTKIDVAIRDYRYTVYELMRRKRNGQLVIPEFQRNPVWKQEQQSRFIESILLKFPLPAFYFNQTVDSQLIVIDGLQRITAIDSFINNEFSLKGLTTLPQLNGQYFKGLLDIQKVKIEDAELHVHTIMPSVPLAVVHDIFSRINTGGTSLTQQEIRNYIFFGKATKLLNKLANSTHFKQAVDGGISTIRMKDQEAILRYLAFKVFDYKEYNGDMGDFLESAMRQLNLLSSIQITALEKDFEQAMKLTYDFFGKSNFRSPSKTNRGRLNIAIFESVANFFSISDASFFSKKKTGIIENYNQLLNDKRYLAAIKASTGNKKNVQIRFELAKQILGKL